ncbi:oligoendopeptidase F [Halolactibacillus alkaliphilus]|uniref:Oligopeptidase F n=1 Tax=Halolactibacillus alkaliphilus TaxID=442899 RepID=A0A511X1H4_9BACI|nr:oligoendopeptidase F [Halolactibacillus alkaliphilus]GEN56799.1 oligoendopeptidase F [Halolactibacillus alkaliphilus]GGN71119.1 oligoendopeptidase F [Halolactibacillus alkaliphilus]SFO81114.1 oligoendopeptidase F [Halolactibacillus alkaliphilus]
MSHKLITRDQQQEQDTWRLEDIFPTDEMWEKERQALTEEIKTFSQFKGTLNESPEHLYQLLVFDDEVSERLGKLYTYAHMRYDQDTTNALYQELNQKAQMLLTKTISETSFIVPEILTIEETRLAYFIDNHQGLEGYRKVLYDINKKRPHTLKEEEEKLLAAMSEVTNGASQTFGMLNNADLTFPEVINEDGEAVELTHGRYINFLESESQQVRKDAYTAMYETYGKFINTFSATLSNQVKKDNVYAKIRHFNSARERALHANHIPETVYDQLVEAVNERLDLLHRYVRLRKRVLKLDEVHMYDLYTPLVSDVETTYSYKDAQQLIIQALQPMGEEYVARLKEGFNHRWVDVYENKGKRSGAYSSGAYGTNPYVLMNWQDNLNNVFTLAHEFGHSLHSYYTRENQPYRYGDYSIFVAEVASTCNEALLNEYMLQETDDLKQQLYLLNHFLEGFRGTVFRQTMFSEFEHLIHTLDQQGEVLTAERLSKEYDQLNRKYFGDEVVYDDYIAKEWARIPHFYYNYYVYQYATGYSAAQTLADQILKEGEPAVKRYLNFLKAGSSLEPIDVLKQAGVDMTQKAPILRALEVFEEKLDAFEQLLEKVEKSSL